MSARVIRFGIVGGVATVVAYLAFMTLLRLGVTYLPAATASWALALGLSYFLNRRFTFGIRRSEGRALEVVIFCLGGLLQLILSLFAYSILMGRMRMEATPAFALNLALTSTFSYLFMKMVTFKHASRRRD